MATISLTIPDDKIDRVKTALGNGTTLTNAQAKAEIIRMVKDRVTSYEGVLAASTEDAKIAAAQSSRHEAVEAARLAAESEITLT